MPRETIKCDNCQKAIRIMATARYAIERDGLIPLCQKCADKIGIKRTSHKGQIQSGYYIAPKS